MRYQTQRHKPKQLTEGEIQYLNNVIEKNWYKGNLNTLKRDVKDLMNQKIYE